MNNSELYGAKMTCMICQQSHLLKDGRIVDFKFVCKQCGQRQGNFKILGDIPLIIFKFIFPLLDPAISTSQLNILIGESSNNY